jgi:predicted MPP superfamily phosphohydrolase
MPAEFFVLLVVAWVGHACVWTSLLNHLYGRPLPKRFLKPWRLFTGVVIAAFPLTYYLPRELGYAVPAYWWACLMAGGGVFPIVTLARLCAPKPAELVDERTHTLDLWPEYGENLIGEGKWAWCPRLPFNCVFRVDFTELTLTLPKLPRELDGLTIHLLSDLHFHGSPSRLFFERVLDEIDARWPMPDLVCLAGDYVDTDAHREWIAPLLGRLSATGPKLAILGNHDLYHDPDAIRAELAAAGCRVLGQTWEAVELRGVPVAVIGHEGPWFPGPDAASPPPGFRLCLSHTPDNAYWGAENGVGLMLCGHVHGGQVRLPVVGSIFVPSVYGRRFDQGVFAVGGMAMVVCRGLSGKEPLRFRCHPQVIRITLRATTPAE